MGRKNTKPKTQKKTTTGTIRVNLSKTTTNAVSAKSVNKLLGKEVTDIGIIRRKVRFYRVVDLSAPDIKNLQKNGFEVMRSWVNIPEDIRIVDFQSAGCTSDFDMRFRVKQSNGRDKTLVAPKSFWLLDTENNLRAELRLLGFELDVINRIFEEAKKALGSDFISRTRIPPKAVLRVMDIHIQKLMRMSPERLTRMWGQWKQKLIHFIDAPEKTSLDGMEPRSMGSNPSRYAMCKAPAPDSTRMGTPHKKRGRKKGSTKKKDFKKKPTDKKSDTKSKSPSPPKKKVVKKTSKGEKKTSKKSASKTSSKKTKTTNKKK